MKKLIITLLGLTSICLQTHTIDLAQSQQTFNFNLDAVLKSLQENRTTLHMLRTELMGAASKETHQTISTAMQQIESSNSALEKQLALHKLYANLHGDLAKLQRINEFEQRASQQTYE